MVPPLYPAIISNPLLCPCPGHFAEAKCATIRGRPGGEMRRGGWVVCPTSSYSRWCCFQNSEGENAGLSQMPTNAPTPRFTALEVHGCHSAHRMGTNRRTMRNRWLHGFALWSGWRFTIIGGENSDRKLGANFSFSPFFTIGGFEVGASSLI